MPFESRRNDPPHSLTPGELSEPTALYVDPASVLPHKPPNSNTSVPHPCFNIDHPDSGYSEVYDRISPVHWVQSKQGKAKDEPIYAEPLTNKQQATGETKSDPFAHLYAQVCKTGRAPSPVSAISASEGGNTSRDTQQTVDDVIYESLGVI